MTYEFDAGWIPFRLTASGLVYTGSGHLDHFTTSYANGATAQIDILDDIEADKVTNGAFTGNATGWTLHAKWTYGTNKINIDGSQAGGETALQSIATLKAGKSYSLTFTTTRTAGSVTASLGGTDGTARSTADTFTETIVCGTTNTNLTFTADATFAGSVDTVTLSRIPEYTVIATGSVNEEALPIPCNFGFNDGIYIVVANATHVCGSYTH